jgi:hypothetical protein
VSYHDGVHWNSVRALDDDSDSPAVYPPEGAGTKGVGNGSGTGTVTGTEADADADMDADVDIRDAGGALSAAFEALSARPPLAAGDDDAAAGKIGDTGDEPRAADGDTPAHDPPPTPSPAAPPLTLAQQRRAERLQARKEEAEHGGARRNGPCHCGSGKVYRRCCLDGDLAVENARKAAIRLGIIDPATEAATGAAGAGNNGMVAGAIHI